MRIILFTGKGGVGKTTVAAATALRCAERGLRTIVLSTDPAHSLGDALDRPLEPEPVLIGPQLSAQETDVVHNLEKYWGIVHDWIKALLAWQGMEPILAEEIAILPGMEELSNLLWINRHFESGDYDVIIVDCAPTGETLRLLSFPEAARWWVEKLLPIQRRVAQVFGPVVRPLTGMPVPERSVFDAAEDLLQQLTRLHALLADRALTSVRLVMNAEKMVIKESQRSFTYLNLYGYGTDAVICNRLLPESVDDPFFDGWKQTQAVYLRFIQDSFAPLPVLTAPLLDHEAIGFEGLREVGQALYGDDDPARIYCATPAQEIGLEEGAYVLSLPAPFTQREDVSLAQRADELIVRVGNNTRNIVLPRMLAGRTARGARMEGGRLKVLFGGQQER